LGRRDTSTLPPAHTFPRLLSLALAVAATLALSAPSPAATTRRVPEEYARIVDALFAAQAGDTVRVAAGTYSWAGNGENFPLPLLSPGVCLMGAGADVCTIDAGQLNSVVRCGAAGVRISGFTLSGGSATKGGGVDIEAGDAEVDHCRVLANTAIERGSGIYAAPGTTPWIHHDVVWGNHDAQPAAPGDPHSVQLTGANALVEFNTIGHGDSNGLIVESGAEPVIRNNIFYQNGSASLHRGRGICALGGPGTVIRNNVFFGNYLAAILVQVVSAFQDLTAQQANDALPDDGILENLDADPAFLAPDSTDVHLTAGSPAIDAGFAGSPLDPDGTRADCGAYAFNQATTGVGCCPGGTPVAGTTIRMRATPSPFHARTLIEFTLPAPVPALDLSMLDARGALVRRLVAGAFAAGGHGLTWEGDDEAGRPVARGIYFARLVVEGRVSTYKLVLLP